MVPIQEFGVLVQHHFQRYGLLAVEVVVVLSAIRERVLLV
jgi:hypothetical protein